MGQVNGRGRFSTLSQLRDPSTDFHENVGFYIGRSYIGVLAYADDLVLTAPSASALGKMLTTCDKYATEFYMSFNASKSNCFVMIPRSHQCLIPLLQ